MNIKEQINKLIQDVKLAILNGDYVFVSCEEIIIDSSFDCKNIEIQIDGVIFKVCMVESHGIIKVGEVLDFFQKGIVFNETEVKELIKIFNAYSIVHKSESKEKRIKELEDELFKLKTK